MHGGPAMIAASAYAGWRGGGEAGGARPERPRERAAEAGDDGQHCTRVGIAAPRNIACSDQCLLPLFQLIDLYRKLDHALFPLGSWHGAPLLRHGVYFGFELLQQRTARKPSQHACHEVRSRTDVRGGNCYKPSLMIAHWLPLTAAGA